MFQLEYDAYNKVDLQNCCEYARKMWLWKCYLGQFANYVKNPGKKCKLWGEINLGDYNCKVRIDQSQHWCSGPVWRDGCGTVL